MEGDMFESNMCFSSNNVGSGRYRLLELPPEILSILHDDGLFKQSLGIKGKPNDEAVLCTSDKTYQIRSVSLSNSFYVVSPSQSEEDSELCIKDSVHEMLEICPCVPKLHIVDHFLKNTTYDDQAGDDTEEELNDYSERPTKRARYKYDSVKSEVQASDKELDRGLVERRVLRLGGYLRKMSLGYLNTVLELTLNALVSLSVPATSVPVLDVAENLENDHEIKKDITRQVMLWFGEFSDPVINSDTVWKMDAPIVVKQIGLGTLANYKDSPISKTEFLKKWKATVGDTFECYVDLSLLDGNYLIHSSLSDLPTITYFPMSALPVKPSERFAELFLTRPQWRLRDISPFLTDIAVDTKGQDKLLMQYARQTTDKEGIKCYTAKGGIVG